MHGQFLRDLPVLLPGEDLLQILVLSNGTVGVVFAHWISSETSVVRVDERMSCLVGCFDRGDVCEAKLLHESVLKRQMGTLHATLGLRRVGADDVDVEFRQRTPELRHAAVLAPM